VKYVLGRDVAGRELVVFPDDIFIVSYPRSGNTWVRFLVANLVNPDGLAALGDIERIIPDIYFYSKRFLKKMRRPRILKSHEYFDPRYKKVVYIVRDPRDVVLSCYRFHLKQRQIDESCSIEEYVPRFVEGTGGVFEEYGSWADNVGSWLGARQNRNGFLLLRYGDLHERPVPELARVASFLDIPCAPDRLVKAVDLSSAQRMRFLEATDSESWFLTKGTRDDIPFVGEAKVGTWRSHLSEHLVALIESAWGPLMNTLGWELVTPGAARRK
jgi:hypothetical protein